MPNRSAGVPPRNFDVVSIPGLSKKAQEALNEAFDAMSTWRVEVANHNEKNCNQVIEKMAAAAAAMGDATPPARATTAMTSAGRAKRRMEAPVERSYPPVRAGVWDRQPSGTCRDRASDGEEIVPATSTSVKARPVPLATPRCRPAPQATNASATSGTRRTGSRGLARRGRR